jgi:hypothetical protein
MSALGFTRATAAFATAIIAAGGARLSNKHLTAIDYLAGEVSGWLAPHTLFSGYAFLYPFVGGNAIAHSFNLANPGTGRITWSGTVTHDANGITGNGTTGGGDTGVALGGTNPYLVSAGVYCRSTATRDSYELANAVPSTTTAALAVASRLTTGDVAKFYHGANFDGSIWTVSSLSTGVSPNAAGMFSALRTSSSNFQSLVCYWQTAGLAPTVVSGSSATTVNSYSNLTFRLLSDTAGGNRSNRNLAFAYLTKQAIISINTQPRHQAFGTIIQRFQTRLGRAVITP